MDAGEVDGGSSPTRRWPIGTAGSLAPVAFVAAAFTWVVATGAEGDAERELFAVELTPAVT